MSSSHPALPTKDASRGEDDRREARNPDALARHQERDSELVKRARAGDPNAWGRLYQNHFDRAYRYLLYLVGDGDVAEELTQETFARAMVSLKKFRGEASVQTWLNRIAVNVTREHWRSQKRRGKINASLTHIADMGDGVLNTSVLLDNFRWDCKGCIPSEVDDCGIQPQ